MTIVPHNGKDNVSSVVRPPICICQLKSRFSELQGKLNCSSNSEIASAERTETDLMAKKENLHKSMTSNYCLREQLRKQLQLLLAEQDGERKSLYIIKTTYMALFY
ncbi:hypothetical protein Leryth_027126 [Lithospermum erythrorhizon]|nr:hypothetical protein Leryth_027126 [Lithospermum erythrorhizon]